MPDQTNSDRGGAADAIAALAGVADGLGLRSLQTPASSLGAGLVFPWQEDYIIVSVAESQTNTVYFTAGVTRGIDQRHRADALEATNDQVAGNPQYPVFLHEADVESSVLLQVSMPLQLFYDVPDLFQFWQEGILQTLPSIRRRLVDKSIPIRQYNLSQEDVIELYRRSFL